MPFLSGKLLIYLREYCLMCKQGNTVLSGSEWQQFILV